MPTPEEIRAQADAIETDHRASREIEDKQDVIIAYLKRLDLRLDAILEFHLTP